MQCWRSPPLHGGCSHLLHCSSDHVRTPHLCCCCQAVGPTGSLSCAPVPLFGLILDGDAAAEAECDCHVEREEGLLSQMNVEHMLALFSPVSHGCYCRRCHCCLFQQDCARYQPHFLSGMGDDAGQL